MILASTPIPDYNVVKEARGQWLSLAAAYGKLLEGVDVGPAMKAFRKNVKWPQLVKSLGRRKLRPGRFVAERPDRFVWTVEDKASDNYRYVCVTVIRTVESDKVRYTAQLIVNFLVGSGRATAVRAGVSAAMELEGADIDLASVSTALTAVLNKLAQEIETAKTKEYAEARAVLLKRRNRIPTHRGYMKDRIDCALAFLPAVDTGAKK